MRTPRTAVAATALGAALILAARGGGSTTPTSAATAPPGTVEPASDAAAPSSVSTAATDAPTAATGKVSANDATQDEIAKVFRAAGIAHASRWAKEVIEYRPYPSDDPTWGKLRAELAKYNPDPAVLELIIASLEP